MKLRGAHKGINKFLLCGVVSLTFLSIFATGFSTWVINTNVYASGLKVSADTVDGAIIQKLVISDVKYAAIYGFVNDKKGVYANSANLKGEFNLNIANAKERISTFSSDSRALSLNLFLKPSLKTDFVFGESASVTGIINNPESQDISSSLAGSFKFVLTESEYSSASIYCSFSISMEYKGLSFPDLSTETFEVFLIPGECRE